MKLKELFENTVFPVGGENSAYAQYFDGTSYLNLLSTEQVVIGNVTFEEGCRNHWHIHHAEKGGGQILLVTSGRGYYQEWGSEPRELKTGDIVNIPANVKHWHGAAPDSAFQHLAIEVPGEGTGTEWCEPVDEAEYNKLK
ncbi:MAG: cupin domain-containing protein [Ruminococcus sp.]|nr:cupin domain-containing protein [Ruminococcus sp.]